MWKSILEKSVCVHNAVFSSCENRRKSTISFLNHQIKIGKIWPKITFYSNKYPFYNNSLPQRHLYIDINISRFSCIQREDFLKNQRDGYLLCPAEMAEMAEIIQLT